MKKLLRTMTLLSLLPIALSCGKDNNTYVTEVGTPSATPTVTTASAQQDVQNLIDDENAYRIGQGQTQLSKGLSCTLQTFTTGDRIQASIVDHNTLAALTTVGSYTLQAPFNQGNDSVDAGLNVLPTSLKNTYKTNYLLRCTGYLVVTESDYQQFDLYSDDASILYIAGTKVIDNDNQHGVTLKTGTKFVRRGVVAFRLDYAQNGGSEALVLNMNGELLSSDKFVH